jgi:rod shape determining protein RodA
MIHPKSRLSLSLLLPASILVLFGLVSFYVLDFTIFKQQLLVFLLALGVYFLFSNLDYRVIGYLSKYIYIAGIIGLIFVFLLGIEARGAVRWLEIAGFRLQISEIVKPFFLIYIAHFLSTNPKRDTITFLKVIGLFAPVFFLVLKQPDLGNALVYASSFGFMLVLAGFPIYYFLAGALLVLIPLPIVYRSLHQYQRDRITAFLDITHDPTGISYNAIQALISVGSGGVMGKGFGNSTQTLLQFLPERHTDFIFATISENLGFIGVMLLLVLYCLLLYKIYKMMIHATDTFSYLVVAGFYFLFLTHIFFNIGMNIALLPIVGITLPFISYGGSSLITNFIILGIISQIDQEKSQDIFEIR